MLLLLVLKLAVIDVTVNDRCLAIPLNAQYTYISKLKPRMIKL